VAIVSEPPDFDTRPGEAVRSTIANWVQCCDHCGYVAPEIGEAHDGAREFIRSTEYQSILKSASFPEVASRFRAYASLLAHVGQLADAGWSALHAAWVCDDKRDAYAAAICRNEALVYWQDGKKQGQAFGDDLSLEYTLVTDLYRRASRFEDATVACAEALTMEDLSPVHEVILRKQKVLIERRDTTAHSLKELGVVAAEKS
jgi:hypothetical protein